MPNRAKVYKPAHVVRARAKIASEAAKTNAERYGYDWRVLRNRLLSDPANVLCHKCKQDGYITEAVHVHHVVPVRVDPSRRLDWDNLMPLCEPCHNSITARGG
jgi:5-methylcytosine-specific restriction protein A